MTKHTQNKPVLGQIKYKRSTILIKNGGGQIQVDCSFH